MVSVGIMDKTRVRITIMKNGKVGVCSFSCSGGASYKSSA